MWQRSGDESRKIGGPCVIWLSDYGWIRAGMRYSLDDGTQLLDGFNVYMYERIRL